MIQLQQFQTGHMSQISLNAALSLNFTRNLQLQRRYDKHVKRIMQIHNQKTNMKQIQQEQQRISLALQKSKQISRSFKEKQFQIKKHHEDRKMLESLYHIQNKKRLQTDVEKHYKHSSKKKIKIFAKDDIYKEFQIELTNKKLADNINHHSSNIQKYKQKLSKEVQDYLKLKQHTQRLKQEGNKLRQTQSMNKIKLKTLPNDHHRQISPQKESESLKNETKQQMYDLLSNLQGNNIE